ncbi:hypothetical protein MTO96_008791 [Rhipicephalus appendiculatus]
MEAAAAFARHTLSSPWAFSDGTRSNATATSESFRLATSSPNGSTPSRAAGAARFDPYAAIYLVRTASRAHTDPRTHARQEERRATDGGAHWNGQSSRQGSLRRVLAGSLISGRRHGPYHPRLCVYTCLRRHAEGSCALIPSVSSDSLSSNHVERMEE